MLTGDIKTKNNTNPDPKPNSNLKPNTNPKPNPNSKPTHTNPNPPNLITNRVNRQLVGL